MKTGIQKIVVCWTFLLLAQGIGCTASKTFPLEAGAKPFQFDPKQVRELVLKKSDPVQGDHWVAALSKQEKSKFWEITSYSDGNHEILDRKADETFIAHLVDTFRFLSLVKEAPPGTLDSFQLDPPWFGIQWRTSDQAFEIEIGSALKDSEQRFIRLNRKQIYLAQGSSFKLLQHLESFQKLRKSRWSDLNADDIDEVVIQIPGKSKIYAQREGTQWTDKNHRALHQNFDSILSLLTESHSKQIIDQADQARHLQQKILTQPSIEAQLIPRKGKENWFKILPVGNTYYGMNSTRPGTVFTINPEMVQTIQNVIGSEKKL
jgi:hypothetical protein